MANQLPRLKTFVTKSTNTLLKLVKNLPQIPGIPAFIRVNNTLRFSANLIYHQLSYNQLMFTKSLKLFLP